MNTNSKMKEFVEENKTVLDNPIIKSFLADEDNFNLVQEAVANPTPENKERVDKAFKEHYHKVKLVKYVSKLIHFFSIDYDRKVNRIKQKYLLILDQPISSDNENDVVAKDLITSENHLSFDNVFGSTLKDQIENEDLIQALTTLTQKQLQILELLYLNMISLKEVAYLLNTSPQNISNQHRKALKKLLDQLV
ncbi:sigma-70 family RNA polymerase sigma factor [Ornithinibacillus sp. FSL M8-0202]|uniref:sigma-70 family RNA polymerase sigma factor n=1 Tax=Ornithinibacillus sp. FSL M8-0202 TaxID=2921616 RepID=UPI0030D02BDA